MGGCASQLHMVHVCWPVVGLIEGGWAHPGASIYGEPEPWCWPGILPGGRLASIPPSSRRPSGSIPACAGEPYDKDIIVPCLRIARFRLLEPPFPRHG